MNAPIRRFVSTFDVRLPDYWPGDSWGQLGRVAQRFALPLSGRLFCGWLGYYLCKNRITGSTSGLVRRFRIHIAVDMR
jgi:hypothetical protein